MRIVTLEIPHLGNRSHLLHDGTVAVVIDPPRDISLVEAAARDAGVEIAAVAETHIHNDYVSGGLELSLRRRADYLVSAEEEVEFDRTGVRDHDTLVFGDLELRALATPGHTPHHLSFLARDLTEPERPAALFSGGSLLHGTVGRTDLVDPALTTPLTRAQWLSARKLGALPPATLLHPTHGFGSFCASSPARAAEGVLTVGDQRLANPALTQPRDTFVAALIAGLGPVPAHYVHMAPRNRGGAWTPRTGRRRGTQELEAALARGAQVVDVRARAAYAAGHVAGSIGVERGSQCAVYAGWVTPWGSELVLVSDSHDDLDAVERELASIGIEGATGVVLDGPVAASSWTSHPRVDWATFAATPAPPDRVLLDVRRPDEWNAAHLHGAANIAVHELPDRIDEVPSGQVWVYCHAGFRAGIAAGLLDRAGRDVVLIDDDFAAAQQLGIPMTRGRAAA